jgi:hypothetical protein
MDNSRQDLDDFIGALLTWARQGAQILEHMSRNGGEELASDSSLDVLACLLQSVLEPVSDRHAAGDLERGTTLVLEACRAIGDELYLVDPPSDAICSPHEADDGHAA